MLLQCAFFAQSQNPSIKYTWQNGCGQAHFIYSYGGSLALASLYSEFTKSPGYWGLTTMFAVGIAWECFVSDTVNGYDLCWNFVGCLAGSLTYMLIDHLIQRKHKKKIYY